MILGSLCAHLLLPLYADSYETFEAISSWAQFLYNPQINVYHFFQDVNLDSQCYQCLFIGGTLCAQLLLQFYTVLFEKIACAYFMA